MKFDLYASKVTRVASLEFIFPVVTKTTLSARYLFRSKSRHELEAIGKVSNVNCTCKYHFIAFPTTYDTVCYLLFNHVLNSTQLLQVSYLDSSLKPASCRSISDSSPLDIPSLSLPSANILCKTSSGLNLELLDLFATEAIVKCISRFLKIASCGHIASCPAQTRSVIGLECWCALFKIWRKSNVTRIFA